MSFEIRVIRGNKRAIAPQKLKLQASRVDITCHTFIVPLARLYAGFSLRRTGRIEMVVRFRVIQPIEWDSTHAPLGVNIPCNSFVTGARPSNYALFLSDIGCVKVLLVAINSEKRDAAAFRGGRGEYLRRS